ncbi:hypothetical protein Tco_1144662 [Tanacetum coccineum]
MTSPIPLPFSMPSPSQTFSFPLTSELCSLMVQTLNLHLNLHLSNLTKTHSLSNVGHEEGGTGIMNSDHNLWNIVINGNSRKKTGRDPKGNIMILPPVSIEENIVVQRETKARTILLQSLPEDHMADFHHLDDARDIWLAVKARFGGNDESKKMRKSMLKQEFSEFRVSESEGLHKGYDRFQKILSQLNQMQAKPDNEDCNMKFLNKHFPPSCLGPLKLYVKGGSSYDSRGTSAPTHSAFIMLDTSSNVIESVLHSFVAESDPQQQITYEDFDQIGKLDLEELDIKCKC